MATHCFACSWATTLVDVSSASHCTLTKSTFVVKGISECPVFLQFYLLPTSVISVKLQNGELFFSCGFIHFHEMHYNCRHILRTLPCATPPSSFSFSDTECLPAAHLSYSSVDSVTGSLCGISHKFLAHLSLSVTQHYSQFLQPVAVQVLYHNT